MTRNHLIAKVAAVNAAAGLINLIRARFERVAQTFVGQKIWKTDFTRTAAWDGAIGPLIRSVNCREATVYQLKSPYSLAFVVRTCAPVPGKDSGVVYHDEVFYLGTVQDRHVEKVTPSEQELPTWTVDQVLALAKVRDEAKQALDRAEIALGPFQRENIWQD